MKEPNGLFQYYPFWPPASQSIQRSTGEAGLRVWSADRQGVPATPSFRARSGVVPKNARPNRIRGAAVSALWIACFLLTFTFPSLNAAMGAAAVYAAICAIGFLFVFRRVSETKGPGLEQIEREDAARTATSASQ